MTTVLLVVLGSALGAPARYLLDRLVQAPHGRVMPWGTWVINVSGSFLLGLLAGVAAQGELDSVIVAALGTGFLGSYTTFSTCSAETLRLVEDRAYRAAAANVVLSLAVGLAAVTAGVAIGLRL